MTLLIIGIICGIIETLIVLLHLTMYTGIFSTAVKERSLYKLTGNGDLTATIFVPARNEEALLGRLLASINAQTDQNFHVTLVNDRSTDSTGKIMNDFAEARPGKVTVVTLTEEPALGNPKLNALVEGMKTITTDLVFSTDADCIVPPKWVEKLKLCFSRDDIGLLLGPIETRKTSAFLSVFHAFDHIFKYSYTAGCAGIGIPTGGFGNNLAVRRSVLEEIGGLSSIDITPTEDAALVSRIRANTNWKARALFSRDVTVITEAQKSWKALTQQEIRWHTGGLFSPDLQTRLSYSFIMIYLTVSVLAIPASFAVPLLWTLPGVSLVTMSLIAVCSGLFSRQPPISYWLALVPFIVLSMFYNSYLTIRALLKPRLIWKGTELEV
ncbi:MAG: glycosyltransferase [Spirochaetales bacterium]|jgi:cellulose synthase/poly-beta-1,6-N-acetylglucosamine synthase-like glycosyltransferase|nr:glycosyltransferase [Spirochaetales bacterium]